VSVGKHRSALAFCVVALIVLGACSNSSGSSSSSSKTTTTKTDKTTAGGGSNQFANLKKIAEPTGTCPSQPGVTDTEIKVGGLAPETGPEAASFKAAEDGIKARFDAANAAGELGKRKIVYVPADEAGDTTRNAEAARQLVENDKVFAIEEVSDKADGSAAYLNEKGVPVVGWHVGIAAWSKFPNMFTFRSPPAADPAHDYSTRNADLIKKLGGTKIALIGGINQSSATYIKQVGEAIAAVPGLKVVYTTNDVQPGNTQFTAIVQRIKESGADTVFTGVDFLQNAALSDQLKQAGVTPKLTLFPGGYDPRVTGLPGVEGAIFGIEFKPFELNTPSFQAFDKATPASVVRNQVSYIGWLSGELFIEGVKAAGINCPTQKAFINNLRMEKGYTANGAFDPVDFANEFGKQFQCVYYVQVENKKFVPLFDGKRFCGKPLTLK
jgi:branched-chain amino acid transport system substrate-binding protein